MEATLFTKPGCNKCNILKKMMDKKNISYDTKDISVDEKAYDTLCAASIMSLPVIETSKGELVSDYNQLLNMFK